MDYYACWNWSIEWDTLCKMYPNETDAIKKELDITEISIDDFAYNLWSDYWIDIEEEREDALCEKLADLSEKFYADNKPLKLGLTYIPSEDRGGDVEPGAFWYVVDVEEKVPAAKKLGAALQLKTWVTFG